MPIMLVHTISLRYPSESRRTYIVRYEEQNHCWLCEHEDCGTANKLHRDEKRGRASRFYGTWVRRRGWGATVRWFPYQFHRPQIVNDVSVKLKCRMHGASKLYDAKDLPARAGDMALGYLGCTASELVERFEHLMQPGMDWSNFGAGGWQIDHIVPLARVDLRDVAQAKQACHADNLRPCWAIENMRKGARLLRGWGEAK
jgi:hypothetical protein